MKTYFFINPAAGQGKGKKQLAAEIREAAADLHTECEIYFTKGVYDGQRQAAQIAESLKGDSARFYACGGDGTLNEIVNAAFGFENIEVGCIPTGTGNDTVRSFSEAGDFRSIKAQLLGDSVPVDLIRYTGVMNGKHQTRYCINMFNVGFDCNVVELAGRLKKKPLISGSFAYLLAVVGIFVKKEGIRLHLTEDGKTLAEGEVLLCAVANGRYCGGGLKTSPQSDPADGFFDVNIINNISRRKFLRLFPAYIKGKHLGMAGLEDIITMKKCARISLAPAAKEFYLCADGEICTAEAIEFEIVKKAARFILPKKPESVNE